MLKHLIPFADRWIALTNVSIRLKNINALNFFIEFLENLTSLTSLTLHFEYFIVIKKIKKVIINRRHQQCSSSTREANIT